MCLSATLLVRFTVLTYPLTARVVEALGNIRPQSSQLAEPLWTYHGITSGISVRELISTLKKEKRKRRRGMNCRTFSQNPSKRGKGHQPPPSTTTNVGTPKMISQPVSSIFLFSPLPSETWRTPGLSIFWCSLPTSSSVCLVFSKYFCTGASFTDTRAYWHISSVDTKSACGISWQSCENCLWKC